MSLKPPHLPEESVLTVHALATRDGRTLLWISGVFSIITALAGDKVGALAGVVAAGAGALELHGVSLLGRGDRRATAWLVGSQFLLIATLLAYVGLRLHFFSNADLSDRIDNEMRRQIKELDFTEDQFLQLTRTLYCGFYVLVGVIGCIYQGRLAWIYWSRRKAVEKAFENEASDS